MAEPNKPLITVSVVSHLQGEMVGSLLEDMERVCHDSALRVILTLNLPEKLPFRPETFSFPVDIVQNPRPLGFGANHNQAFRQASGMFFGVLNPDLRFSRNPFPQLCSALQAGKPIGVIAPEVEDEARNMADNARRFPTPFRILKRILGNSLEPDYPLGDQPLPVDWLAGLFLLFPFRLFTAINGFDERYFMYCEDVDICARFRLAGYEVYWDPRISVIHQAQRHSHRRLNHLKWHVVSLIRFFNSEVFSALRQRFL
jgi:N-acetylglucosaminyl-diphospho-decaprenol L-rhamnosyltransferase